MNSYFTIPDSVEVLTAILENLDYQLDETQGTFP
jgi:hypothetical protein